MNSRSVTKQCKLDFLPNLLGITQSEIFLNDQIITWLKEGHHLTTSAWCQYRAPYLVTRWLFPNKRLLLITVLPILILFRHIKRHRTHYDVTLWWRHFLTWFLVKWCVARFVPTILCLKMIWSILLESTSKGLILKNIAFTSIFHKNNVNIYYLFGRFGAKITFNRFVLRAYITLNCRTQVSSENYFIGTRFFTKKIELRARNYVVLKSLVVGLNSR